MISCCSKHGLVVSGQNKMYMAGGEYPDGSASKAVWRYDPALDVWQEVESMHTTRSELGKTLTIKIMFLAASTITCIGLFLSVTIRKYKYALF